jgi:lycopene beta-cyclase
MPTISNDNNTYKSQHLPGKDYDYIITGAGCAGLSLLMRMLQHPSISKKNILLVEKDFKNLNDRTWCFWENKPGFFEPVVLKYWQQLQFTSPGFSKSFNILPYTYKMIRGIDFYSHCLSQVERHPNVEIQYGIVSQLQTQPGGASMIFNGEAIQARYIFNSILFQQPLLKKGEYFLWQHFKGWTIETETDCFMEGTATIMDFNTSQLFGTTFIYIMPLNSKKALVEYTVFSEALLETAVYDTGLRNYLNKYLGNTTYKVIEEEFGAIPMTNHAFTATDGNIINMGTAGGQTKGSSGYSFQFIQKRAEAIVQSLVQNEHPFAGHNRGTSRFHFYDSILLQLLSRKKLAGETIFTKLFAKNDAKLILKFLDNQTTIAEDFRIISKLPAIPFIQAALQNMMKL